MVSWSVPISDRLTHSIRLLACRGRENEMRIVKNKKHLKLVVLAVLLVVSFTNVVLLETLDEKYHLFFSIPLFTICGIAGIVFLVLLVRDINEEHKEWVVSEYAQRMEVVRVQLRKTRSGRLLEWAGTHLFLGSYALAALGALATAFTKNPAYFVIAVVWFGAMLIPNLIIVWLYRRVLANIDKQMLEEELAGLYAQIGKMNRLTQAVESARTRYLAKVDVIRNFVLKHQMHDRSSSYVVRAQLTAHLLELEAITTETDTFSKIEGMAEAHERIVRRYYALCSDVQSGQPPM